MRRSAVIAPHEQTERHVPDNFFDQLEALKDALAEAEVMAADFTIERYASPDGSVKEVPRITVGGLSGDVY